MALLALLKRRFCRHQWDASRSRKGTFVCRLCGARKDEEAGAG
jgi:hypothetical protein